MADLIDRKSAIDEAYAVIVDDAVYDVVQVETLEGLPSAQQCEYWDSESNYCALYRQSAQPIDAVEVVRCKDCKLSEPGIGIVEYWCCYWDNKTLENGYCSYGERKNDD